MNPKRPPISVLTKLGSIVMHVDALLDENGRVYDLKQFRAMIKDAELQEWLQAMNKKALTPLKR